MYFVRYLERKPTGGRRVLLTFKMFANYNRCINLLGAFAVDDSWNQKDLSLHLSAKRELTPLLVFWTIKRFFLLYMKVQKVTL